MESEEIFPEGYEFSEEIDDNAELQEQQEKEQEDEESFVEIESNNEQEETIEAEVANATEDKSTENNKVPGE